MAINPATIFSTLGNPNSIIPLGVKDVAASAGMTAGSLVTGKEEGVDRFIDEFGTEVIWLLGIPTFKRIFDITGFKLFGLDSKFDVRNLENKELFEKIKQHAQDEKVKKELDKISNKQKLFKNLVATKFVISTGLTIATYLLLTKFKQKYTENKIRKNLIDEYNNSKQDNNADNKADSQNISTKESTFKGIGPVVQQFAFSPVKNMYILEGAITTTRLKESRSPQEFVGYAIKEAMTLAFLYYAGGKIQRMMEQSSIKKHHKNISLDARVIEGADLKNSFTDGSVEKGLAEFKKAASLSDIEFYEFLHKNPDNIVVKSAKTSDIIHRVEEPRKWYQIFKKKVYTDKIDVRKLNDLKDIKTVGNHIEMLHSQYKKALSNGDTTENFFKSLKKLKRNSVIANIGISAFALGVLTPGVMLAKRLIAKEDTEFHTKKEIRQQLIDEGIIA